MVLIADPQLVDPHTYPGRPWLLSSLTIYYTDLYIRKSFQHIRDTLGPDSIFFLGDLFDGGREWSTSLAPSAETENTDKRWAKYGQRYWFHEYVRFNRIFIDPWLRGEKLKKHNLSGRKLIAELPGNHDLGLGNGIRMPARNRFNTYFGDGNRIDIVGNHTFISVDTVSLSAKGQMDPATGSQMMNDEEEHAKSIWAPVDHFLHTAGARKARAIKRELRVRNGQSENTELEHVAMELDDPRSYTIPVESKPDTDIPSVLLTHVPLYRAPGTPCGPLRERFPPTKSSKDSNPVEKDEGNAIHVQAGVQYQNVLTSTISNEIVNLVGDITHVFSGDDHDYCEVVHREYTSMGGGIREITVKSISWAMGVREPGFLLVSLWNPVDAQGKAISSESTTKTTIQSHLCLLPNQLSIFIRYAWLLILTIIVMVTRSYLLAYRKGSAGNVSRGHYLPVSGMDMLRKKDDTMTPLNRSRVNSQSKSSSSDSSSQNGLAVRANAARAKSSSPHHGYGYELQATDSSLESGVNGSNWNDIDLADSGRRRAVGGLHGVFLETRRSLSIVASVVGVWYIWLLWSS